ncbi:MAG: hypothetical protein DRP08_03310 [Candidatus Aenigmatarchaeota archaeon]|nr:MAG: hypothetical protein DRP08_03310 [Candidatus Aenigmarchaeota archaeon]
MEAFIRETLKILRKEKLMDKLAIPVVKVYMWNLTLMMQSYYKARIMSFNEASGISEKVVERLISLSASKIYDKVTKTLDNMET